MYKLYLGSLCAEGIGTSESLPLISKHCIPCCHGKMYIMILSLHHFSPPLILCSEPYFMPTRDSMELVISCKNSRSCHTWEHVCSSPSKQCRKPLSAYYNFQGMECILILRRLSRSQHHSSAQCIKRVGADARERRHTPA